MAVFTCFNHGTGANRVSGQIKGEIVAVLSQLTLGGEAEIANGVVQPGSHLINEGPGSSKGGLDHPSVDNPYLGIEKGNLNGLRGASDFKKHFYGETDNHWKITGTLVGGGWTDNVARTVYIIQSLKFGHGIDIRTVNMTGWSRGGVTCIRIANALWDVFREEIECNLFCIDPVAGAAVPTLLEAGLRKEDTRILHPNVKNFFAILSLHELRKSFKPQDLSRMTWDHGATQVMFLPMAGKHSNQPIRKENIGETYDISISMIYAFLKHFGTDFAGPPPHYIATPQDMCEKYALMRQNMNTGMYQHNQNKGLGQRVQGGFARREFAKTANMRQYVAGGKRSYWVNEHHRACFKRAYPSLYHLVFHLPLGLTKRSVTENLAGASLINSLQEYNFIERTDRGFVARCGSGSYNCGDDATGGLHAEWSGGIPLA